MHMPTQTSANQTAPPIVKWLTKAEAAEHARVGIREIQNAVNAGELQAYYVGKGRAKYTLDAAEVDAWRKSKAFEPK